MLYAMHIRRYDYFAAALRRYANNTLIALPADEQANVAFDRR